MITTSVAAPRQNGVGRNQGSVVEEVTPPPKNLDCNPALWFGENEKKPVLQKHSLLPLNLNTAVAAVGF